MKEKVKENKTFNLLIIFLLWSHGYIKDPKYLSFRFIMSYFEMKWESNSQEFRENLDLNIANSAPQRKRSIKNQFNPNMPNSTSQRKNSENIQFPCFMCSKVF